MPKETFDNHTPSAEQIVTIEAIREAFNATRDEIMKTPYTRERSLAITNLEQACMWAVKGAILFEEPAK